MKRNVPSSKNTHGVTVPVLVSILAVMPFFALEWYTTSYFSNGVPWAVFITLFLEAFFFTAVLLSAFKDIRGHITHLTYAKWLLFIVKMVFLFILAWAFIYMIADQMPCFLGKNGC